MTRLAGCPHLHYVGSSVERSAHYPVEVRSHRGSIMVCELLLAERKLKPHEVAVRYTIAAHSMTRALKVTLGTTVQPRRTPVKPAYLESEFTSIAQVRAPSISKMDVGTFGIQVAAFRFRAFGADDSNHATDAAFAGKLLAVRTNHAAARVSHAKCDRRISRKHVT